jgi:prepilin-type N-terminal cleavage/methylation domain-containing protein
MKHASRSGFSLIELIISIAIMTIIVLAIYGVLEISTSTYHTGTAKTQMENVARSIVQYIAANVQAASRGTIRDPNTGAAPSQLSPSSTITYQVSLGSDGSGNLTLGAPHTVAWTLDDSNPLDVMVNIGKVTYTDGDLGFTKDLGVNVAQNLDLSDEVPANGVDDNGNGLVDEAGLPGLCFIYNNGSLLILCTVQGMDHRGQLIQATVHTTVFIKNP